MSKIILVFAVLCLSAHAALFDRPEITLSISPKLKERMEQKDSLLPTFNPEVNLKTLLRARPEVWSFDDLDQGSKLATQLKVDFEFIDGTKNEDQYCRLLSVKKDSNEIPLEWSLKMGVDFISGGSNVVGDHIRLCLEQTREAMGVALKRGDSIVYVAPKKLQEDLDKYRVNAKLNEVTRRKVLKTAEFVNKYGKCPTDVRSYALLLQVWKEVKDSSRVDLIQLNQDLDKQLNGNRAVTSCAFNRDWNQHYSFDVEFSCDPSSEACQMWKIPGGKQDWQLRKDADEFEYQGFGFLGLRLGKQSIHKKGNVLDLRLVPLADNLYLESYVDLQGFPVALGLLTLAPKP